MDNNNKNYFNQVLYENFHILCINEFNKEDIKQNDNYKGKLQEISYAEALKSYFENGLNINHYLVDKERYEGIPVTMIEDITIAASNSQALLIAYDNISSEFFVELPYKEKKSIVSHLIGKRFFSNGDIEYLLKIIYGKGFYLAQEKTGSLEIDWIETQNLDAIKVLFQEQKEFNFDFQYRYKDKEIDFTSLVSLLISKERSLQEIGYEIRIKNLEFIQEEANRLILNQMIQNIPAMAHGNTKEENNNEKDDFKI